MAADAGERLVEALDDLVRSLEALRSLGRQLTVQEVHLAELARTQPPLRPGKPAPPQAKGRPVAKPKSTVDAKVPEGGLEAVRAELGDCTRCPLHEGRRNIVFGQGSPTAELMFVGEGPGADEDEQGLPFVGRAGQLLNRMIAAMGKARGDVYIANIVKCRPPGNREPAENEALTCVPFLRKQIEVIRPKAIVCLGRVAVQRLLETNEPISRLRGAWRLYGDIRVMPTYHPAYLLRNPAAKKPAWEDLQAVMVELGWPLPERKG